MRAAPHGARRRFSTVLVSWLFLMVRRAGLMRRPTPPAAVSSWFLMPHGCFSCVLMVLPALFSWCLALGMYRSFQFRPVGFVACRWLILLLLPFACSFFFFSSPRPSRRTCACRSPPAATLFAPFARAPATWFHQHFLLPGPAFARLVPILPPPGCLDGGSRALPFLRCCCDRTFALLFCPPLYPDVVLHSMCRVDQLPVWVRS